ncbi:MAG: ribose 5-phosphate isomerase B [Coriobacteriaceae bacterium]|jgi:ribose 5-phosphate isomerase B|nr:ribose 5-phosphate isomerase B [Coriobacteriaceae bacterium]
MDISLASDHAGFYLKQHMAAYLAAKGHQVTDRGPEDEARVDYPDYAAKVAADVSGGLTEKGILICGTGIGMAIAANKCPGIRAANVASPAFAALAREHNDANIVCLSARFIDASTNEAIVDAFLATAFAGGRHQERVDKISCLEAQCE